MLEPDWVASVNCRALEAGRMTGTRGWYLP